MRVHLPAGQLPSLGWMVVHFSQIRVCSLNFAQQLYNATIELRKSFAGDCGNQQYFPTGGFSQKFGTGFGVRQFSLGHTQDLGAFDQLRIIQTQFIANLIVVFQRI